MEREKRDTEKARSRAELSGNAVRVLESRTLEASHRRLAELLMPGMEVLDAGCGTGAITQGIARSVGPAGRVVGTDNNQALIEQAGRQWGEVPGLSFDCRDIYRLPYRDAFDLATASRVLQWLSDPADALRALKACVKPGGRVLVLDYNHEKLEWETEPPASMKAFYAAFLRWRSDAGMCNAIADRLPELFQEAGFRDIAFTSQHETVRRGEPGFERGMGIWAEVAASRGRQMADDGYVTEEERACAEREYRSWMETEAVGQTMYLLAVEGIKEA